MAIDTKIAWTDATFNPWWGCTKVSPGCDNCYAEAFDRRTGGQHWGKNQPRRILSENAWRQPLLWNKQCAEEGRTMFVFCASMADVMDDEAPKGERRRLWHLINETPFLNWQLLTKRPQRYVRNLPEHGFYHDNVILGMTAENQTFYNKRIHHLSAAQKVLFARNCARSKNRAPVRTFVSYEPALGPLSLLDHNCVPDWLIFGGETGGNRRPMKIEWAESIKAECEMLGVSFFMKQMSAPTPAKASALIPAHLLAKGMPYDLPSR